MADSTQQPDYYLHLDLAEGGLDPQPHGDTGESFLEFPESGSEEAAAMAQNSAIHGVNQWPDSSVKTTPTLDNAVSVREPTLDDSSVGNYTVLGTPVIIEPNTVHWNSARQVYGSLMDMELSKLSPPEQVSDCITPDLIFPSKNAQDKFSVTESQAEDTRIKASEASTSVAPLPTTTQHSSAKQTSGDSKKISIQLMTATQSLTDIRRSTRARKPSSLATQSEEYLAMGLNMISAPAERVTRSKKVYCYCQKPDDGEVMIQCDNCRQWFHGACVDVTDEIAELMELKNEKFFCDPCTEKLKGKMMLLLLYFLCSVYSQFVFFWIRISLFVFLFSFSFSFFFLLHKI
ncbi:hypothetical protein BCR41DRAFT_218193 [Lobosporangium transversale]|uniref:PHD-type domain-containing protein n=1 Tax=Lobosporangium transversale TaxID=64571 RepID=A0A1Y2G6Y9_9FUNG|nr:hypothetical protein BCR41DRAFT_218193 [Lobosporangium transversale]ORY99536.1 hypothetical protein BCR41DRAFT_218193 [Lobosporangium transversale]|eukprot:XP_021875862.1 hypothetical protein BCR41DRAFT_218193 [Lobosporangium transversale]